MGSVDFLGNPLGLMNDVSEGMSGLLEGNVTALLRNVTHGLSNSAAKVTGKDYICSDKFVIIKNNAVEE